MIKTSAERRSATNVQALLKKLQIADVNAGACSGPNGWIDEADATPLVSVNPTTGEPIASVRLASAAASDTVIADAARAFPDDLYDVTPATLADLGVDELGPLQLVWGLAKAKVLRADRGTGS